MRAAVADVGAEAEIAAVLTSGNSLASASWRDWAINSPPGVHSSPSSSHTPRTDSRLVKRHRTKSSGPIPAGGSGRRMWIVRSSVGAATIRPRAANAAGAHASASAATSGASSVRGTVVRSQPPVCVSAPSAGRSS